MQIENKNIYITGASRGIGLACAREFNERGARVYLCNRKRDESLSSHFKRPENVFYKDLDLMDKSSIEAFAKDCSDIDILFNNAGQLTGGLLEDQPVEDILSMYQVNLVGAVHLTRLVLPLMLEKKEAKIVFNSSVSGAMSLPCASTYASAKTGLAALAKSLQIELKGTGVSTLTLMTPGIKTRMFDKITDLYGKHLDVSKLSSITPEYYAQKVAESIEDDRLEYWPKGSVGFVLALARHTPKLFRLLAGIGFKRS